MKIFIGNIVEKVRVEIIIIKITIIVSKSLEKFSSLFAYSFYISIIF